MHIYCDTLEKQDILWKTGGSCVKMSEGSVNDQFSEECLGEDNPESNMKDPVNTVLKGKISTLPKQPSNVLKIYISSTNEDFVHERQRLWEDTLPELQRYLLGHGVEVQFVDVHQGARFDHAYNRRMFDRHLQLLQDCHKVSMGVFFICLVGNRHGVVPLPSFIDEQEFKVVKEEAYRKGKDIKMLENWYVKDTNAIPAAYVLRPIGKRYPALDDGSYNKNTKHLETELSEWQFTFTQLQEMIQQGAEVCYRDDSHDQKHKQQRFFMSTVEQELQQALELSRSNSLVFVRTFANMGWKGKAAATYADVKKTGDVDKISQQMNKTFREIIADKFNEDNKVSFNVAWREDGLTPSTFEPHAAYLEDFHNAVLTQVTELIDKHLQMNNNNPSIPAHTDDATGQLYTEVLSHSMLFRKALRETRVRGFEGIEEKLKNFIVKNNNMEHKMVLLEGTEASGKTLLSSRIATLGPELLGEECVVILRAIGTTTLSSSETNLLMNICCQLEYNLKGTMDCLFLKLDSLVRYFQEILYSYSNLSKTAIIILDGLQNINWDTMSTMQQPSLTWLFSDLPPGVHMFVTINNNMKPLPQIAGFIEKARGLEGSLEVSCLSETSLHQMIKDGFFGSNRKLKVEQENIIIEVCKNKGAPFHLKLCVDEALLWPSFVASDAFSSKFASTLDIALKHRFDKVEEKYGEQLIGKVSLYLSTSYGGVSETELLDILSCDNDIIELLFQYRDISKALTVLRFPSHLWWALKSDFGCCIRERHLYGKKLLMWSHDMIAQTVKHRYCPTVDDTKQAHCDFANLFLEKWLGNRPLVNPKKGFEIIDTGNRFVNYQPLLCSDTKYNLRKIYTLWYHLRHSGDKNNLKEHTFLNFDYLLSKLHCTSIHVLVNDLQVTLSHILDADLKLVLHSLLHGERILGHDPLQLAGELIAHLRQIKADCSYLAVAFSEFSPHFLEALVQQSMEWCDSFTLPLLVPLSTWLPDPRVSQAASFFCGDGPLDHLCMTSNYQHLFCSTRVKDNTQACQVLMYHVPSSFLVKRFSGCLADITCMAMIHVNQKLVCGSSDAHIYMWDITTGDLTRIRQHTKAVLCLAYARQNDILVTGSKDKSFKLTSLKTMETLHHIEDQEGEITHVLVTNGETMLVTASSVCKIKVWYLEDLTLLSTIESGIPNTISTLALSPDNTFLILGCEEGSVIVKAFTTGSDVHTIEGLGGQATAIAVSSDSKHCVIGCSDGVLYTFNFRTKALVHKHRHKKAQYFTEDLEIINHVSCLEISADENFIFSACDDEVAVWTFFKETNNSLIDDKHTDIVTCMGMSKDGKIGLTGSRDWSIKVWNLEIPDYMATWTGHTGQVTCLSITEDNTFAVSGSEDTTIKVWNVTTGCVITDYMEHKSSITQVCAIREYSKVLSAEEDGGIKIWSAENGNSIWSMEADGRFCEVSPSLTHVVSGDMEQNLTVWQVCDGHPVGNRLNHSDCITCASYSPDSQLLVTGSADCSLKVWEVATAKLTQVLVEHEGIISSAVIASGNHTVVSASYDKRVLVWNISTGAVEHHLLGHTMHVMCVKVTKDGTVAITGSRDGTLRVWNILRGTPVTMFDMHAPVFSFHITGNAERIMVHLERNSAVPLMCLHNSPSGADKNSSDVDMHTLSERRILPIKPKPVATHRPNTIYPLPRKKRTESRPPSVSTIPEIIKVSPMKAPTIQDAVKAQEVNQEKRIAICREQSSMGGGAPRNNKTKAQPAKVKKESNICMIL